MVDVTIRIPLEGTFNIVNNQFIKQDIIQMTDNRFLVYVQQENQNLGYLAIVEYDDFVNSFNYSVIKQRLVFKDTPSSDVKLFRLSNIRALLVRDNNAHIINIDNNDIIIELTKLAFFTRALLNLNVNLNSRNYEIFTGDNLIDNELLVLENEGIYPSGTSSLAELKFYHVVYNPETNELTKILRIDFTDPNNINNPTVTPNTLRGSMKVKIYPLANTSNYYLGVSAVISSLGISANIVQIFSGIINSSGQIQELITIPTTSFTPRMAIAMDSNTFIYFSSTLSARIYNKEQDNFITPLPLTGISNTEVINDLIHLDNNNFMIYHLNDRIRVVNLLTSSLMRINSFVQTLSDSRQFYKNNSVKWNDELIVFYNFRNTVSINGIPYINFPIVRVYQELL